MGVGFESYCVYELELINYFLRVLRPLLRKRIVKIMMMVKERVPPVAVLY